MFVKKILDQLPFWPIIIIATIFLLMPFGEPHLISKINMLITGEPLLPIDWFDIFVHAGPAVLALLKVWRTAQLKGQGSDQPDTE